jgi:dTDP-4-amino-4,6-dideoxygalactose transaminase
MLKIPFYKPSIGDDEINEVVDSLRNGWLTTGPKTKRFEQEFASYIGQSHAIAVNSCTAALHLALEAIGLKPGQTVVVPTMTFAATAEVVRYFNAHPLLVDCRPEDLNLDVQAADEQIKRALRNSEEVVAILPVHYAGQIGDVHGVQKLAAKYGLKIIEDAAHCCPALYRDDILSPWQSVGSAAAVTCFSFYANKTITTGEGGMACTQNAAYADRMRIMSLHGISRDAWKRYTAEGSWFYEIVAPGFKYNLTDIAAAIGLHQLRKADLLHQKRTMLAKLYSELLGEVDEVVLPKEQVNRVHSWHLYSVQLQTDLMSIDRGEVISQLKEAGIGASVHWMPLHMHPYYREKFGYTETNFPCATSVFPKLLTLPLYPDMSDDDVTHVSNCLKKMITRSHRRVRGWRECQITVEPVVTAS